MKYLMPPGASAIVPLSVMMFLQLLRLGAWYVSMTGFMIPKGMGGPIAAPPYSVGPHRGDHLAVLPWAHRGPVLLHGARVGALHVIGGGLICLAPLAASVYDPKTTGPRSCTRTSSCCWRTCSATCRHWG